MIAKVKSSIVFSVVFLVHIQFVLNIQYHVKVLYVYILYKGFTNKIINNKRYSNLKLNLVKTDE